MLTAIDVANFFIYLNKKDKQLIFDNAFLNNVIYIAQGWFSQKNDQNLFNEKMYAYENGVYIESVYLAFKKYENNLINNYYGELDISKFISIEIELLIYMYDYYCQLSADEVKKIVCNQKSPWWEAINSENKVVNKDAWKHFLNERKFFDNLIN